MKVLLIVIGKTDEKYLTQGIGIYTRRLQHYVKFDIEVIPDVKGKQPGVEQLKQKEGELILSKLLPGDFVVLLDEAGIEYTSVGFSEMLQKKMLSGQKRIVFVVGGAYGFSAEVYTAANSKMALSQMTFSHQMVRLVFVEQVYRAMTILRNEPYHHQ